jgi:hypothetical protein
MLLVWKNDRDSACHVTHGNFDLARSQVVATIWENRTQFLNRCYATELALPIRSYIVLYSCSYIICVLLS